jgi:hypothetical protein
MLFYVSLRLGMISNPLGESYVVYPYDSCQIVKNAIDVRTIAKYPSPAVYGIQETWGSV